MNLTILMGRLARDPETQTTTTGKLKCRMTIAVDRPKARDGTQSADFISLIAWGKTAEFAEKYLSKGQRILVEGRITAGRYEKDDGTKVYTTDVVVNQVEFAGGNGRKTEGAESAGGDDIPFWER